jgi:hypothetical protein
LSDLQKEEMMTTRVAKLDGSYKRLPASPFQVQSGFPPAFLQVTGS